MLGGNCRGVGMAAGTAGESTVCCQHLLFQPPQAGPGSMPRSRTNAVRNAR